MTNDQDRDPRRRGGWLTSRQDDLEAWLRGHRERAGEGGPLHPAVRAFGDLVEGDPILRMHAHRMIEEEPQAKGYSEQPVESLDQLLVLMDEVLTTAPEYGEAMVATPLGAVLDWTMGTPAGFAFYRDPRVNAALRDVLNAWAEYLEGPDSLSVLNASPSGWMGQAAREAIGIERFQHDPDAPHWGFTSWNDFFTRRLAEQARPVAEPDDDTVVVAACEATPYRIANGVQRSDDFWIKREPYSLVEMLAGDESVDALVGGTVFQAFLSPTDYHRWHSPVAGRILRATVVPGTYYSEADSQGDAAAEPTVSQGYLTHVATRAVVVLEADAASIGTLALVFVGMSDVSSCIVAPGIAPGAHVAKGDELGWFQYGGSSWCGVFAPGVIADFALDAVPQEAAGPLPVRSRLARVASAR
ncbi:phosphatidylserine decarboxylase family protein [uncultured Amnibacterium sp.]|uniref:phosphatidylserine decarboxylase family protein n=1 Tax=uncultured Amnibacterium sp. TaxID=1631851 RepID=UPI0035CC6593